MTTNSSDIIIAIKVDFLLLRLILKLMKKIIFLLSALVVILLLPKLVTHASSDSATPPFRIDCLNNPNQTRFKDNADGTISDKCTKLLWQKSSSNTQPVTGGTWDQAQTYCSNLVLGTQTGWRVPTIQELFSIVNYSNTNGIYTYSPFEFGDTNETGLYLWSSTPRVDNSTYAWSVQFTNVNSANGGSVNTYNKIDPFEVRCVYSQ